MNPRRPKVSVVRTGAANLASVVAAFERLDCVVSLVADAREATRSDRIVLPGVGAFAAARSALAAGNLAEALQQRIERGRPTLGICLGMQLMAEGSDEAPGEIGLGALPGQAAKFAANGRRVPQMGWNLVEPTNDCRIVPTGYAYFANSYYLAECVAGWNAAWAAYGVRFLAAAERGPVVGCQFHPELSGAYGRTLLAQWLKA